MSVLRALWGRFGGIGGPLALQRLAFGKIGPQFGSEALAAITVISAWLGHSGAVVVVGTKTSGCRLLIARNGGAWPQIYGATGIDCRSCEPACEGGGIVSVSAGRW